MEQQPLAYLNPTFLESDEARPLRILSEYLEPLGRFKTGNIQDTVAFFGSARIHSQAQAQRTVAALGSRPGSPGPGDDERRRARRALEWSRYYEEARELASLLTTWSLSLSSPLHRFVVCSGGGPGIMEAANRGASEAGGKTIGLNITLPFERGAANPYVTEDLRFEFHYFFMRKFWFAYLAKALVVFPGGYGTLDEMFEILTLMQTDKLANQIQIILYGLEYWDAILKFEPLFDWGAIGEHDIDLLHRVDTPQQAFDLLKAHLSEHHLEPQNPPERQAPGIATTRD